MRTLRVSVTAKDIREGNRQSCSRCPVALAVRRHMHGVRVTSEFLFTDGHDHPTAELPTAAKVFVHKFDTGSRVEPFRFRIKVPE